jgi:hypothetical protein
VRQESEATSVDARALMSHTTGGQALHERLPMAKEKRTGPKTPPEELYLNKDVTGVAPQQKVDAAVAGGAGQLAQNPPLRSKGRKGGSIVDTVASLFPSRRAGAPSLLAASVPATDTKLFDAKKLNPHIPLPQRVENFRKSVNDERPGAASGQVASVATVGGRKGFQLRSLCAYAASGAAGCACPLLLFLRPDFPHASSLLLSSGI